jgi:hypothetical protein
MKKYFFAFLSLSFSSQLIAQDNVCRALEGSIIINSDNEFIGTVSNSFNRDSIFNEYGKFGNQYNSASIWNKYGKNGNEYQSGSAFNKYTSSPPRIIKDRQVIGYLSANKSKSGAINPILLGALCYDFTPPQ